MLLATLKKNLMANDMERFCLNMKSFFASIPYELHIKQEKYYQTLFFALTKLIGARPVAE